MKRPSKLQTRPAACTPEKAVLEEEWQFLAGFEVDVRLGRRLMRTAVVDSATADGRIAWLCRQGVQERTLILKAEGYGLWVTKIDDRRIRERKEIA